MARRPFTICSRDTTNRSLRPRRNRSSNLLQIANSDTVHRLSQCYIVQRGSRSSTRAATWIRSWTGRASDIRRRYSTINLWMSPSSAEDIHRRRQLCDCKTWYWKRFVHHVKSARRISDPLAGIQAIPDGVQAVHEGYYTFGDARPSQERQVGELSPGQT